MARSFSWLLVGMEDLGRHLCLGLRLVFVIKCYIHGVCHALGDLSDGQGDIYW